MAILTEQIPRKTSPLNLNFNFTDIAEGTGVVVYNGMTTNDDSAGTVHRLVSTNEAFYSSTLASGSSSTIEEGETYNFDTTGFNLPRTVRGTAYVSIPCSLPDADASTGYITAQLKKVDENSNVTNLSSAFTTTISQSGTPTAFMVLIALPLTKTIIKKADKIRLAVTAVHTANDSVAIGHDPANRDTGIISPSTNANVTSKLRAYIPFEINN